MSACLIPTPTGAGARASSAARSRGWCKKPAGKMVATWIGGSGRLWQTGVRAAPAWMEGKFYCGRRRRRTPQPRLRKIRSGVDSPGMTPSPICSTLPKVGFSLVPSFESSFELDPLSNNLTNPQCTIEGESRRRLLREAGNAASGAGVGTACLALLRPSRTRQEWRESGRDGRALSRPRGGCGRVQGGAKLICWVG